MSIPQDVWLCKSNNASVTVFENHVHPLPGFELQSSGLLCLYSICLCYLGHLELLHKIHIMAFFYITDDNEFRNLIVWLEDQKIRHYKIEDRAALRNTPAPEWTKAFESVSFKFTMQYHVKVTHWHTFSVINKTLHSVTM